jgi:hypothetical protein
LEIIARISGLCLNRRLALPGDSLKSLIVEEEAEVVAIGMVIVEERVQVL